MPAIRLYLSRFGEALTMARWLWYVCTMAVGAWGALAASALTFGEDGIERLELGIAGQWRLGEWTPFVCEISPKVANRHPVKSRVTCRDVDDQPAVYEMMLVPHPRLERVVLGHFLLGRAHGRIEIQLLDAAGAVVAERSLAVRAEGALWRIWPATTRLVAFVGLAPEARMLLPSSAALRSGTEATNLIEVADVALFPWHPRGLQNIDTLVLSAANPDVLQQLTAAHIDALRQWIQQGGKLIIWTAPNADQNPLGQRLITELLPGEWLGAAELRSSRQLEVQVNAKEPLINSSRPRIDVARVAPADAVVALQQGDIPLVVRRAEGFGLLTFVALPLDNETLRQWPGSANLLEQLIAGIRWTEERGGTETFSSRVTHYGYRDLAGQLRAALDQFPRLTVVSFSMIAILIGMFILIVGPLDYFLLKRWLKRPEWTWFTFLLWVVVFSCVALWIARQTKPSVVQLRSLEIIDWDARNGNLRGTFWAGLFSPNVAVRDVGISVAASFADRVSETDVMVMGLPGTGLGGTESGAGIGRPSAAYRVVEMADDGDGDRTAMERVTLPVASSRSFVGTWRGTANTSVRSRLRFHRRTGRLVGNFVNPLVEPLHNVRIFYENRGYSIEASIDPGESVDLIEARERTAKAVLTWRASRSDDPTQSEPWNVADGDVRRIAQLLMLYQAAGGQGYANLTHAYWNRIDASDTLHAGCAVLIGELPQGAAQLTLDGRPIDASQRLETTVVRFILPVVVESGATPR